MNDITKINWEKCNGLIPAIIQHHQTLQVLMLGFMNAEALATTCNTKQVTFYSRSKQRLWTKGETSGNTLQLMELHVDCDQDSLLILAAPTGPTCHRSTPSCFSEMDAPGMGLLAKLEAVVEQRFYERPEGSYCTRLFAEGIERIAQKVGEEGVEVALAGVLGRRQEIINESADLIFHLFLLLRQSDIAVEDVLREIRERM